MSADILRFGGSPHDEAQRLLPWFANGTLDDDERVVVETHLQACPDCRRELEWLRAVGDACTADADPPVAPDFARLRRALPRHAPRSRRPRATLRARWAGSDPWLRGALVAQCAALALLAVALAMRAGTDAPASRYHTLSDARSTPTALPGESSLVVVFDPDIRVRDAQRLLQASGGRVVDGPSDAGAYTVAVPRARAIAARDALRGAKGVLLVEDMGAMESR